MLTVRAPSLRRRGDSGAQAPLHTQPACAQNAEDEMATGIVKWFNNEKAMASSRRMMAARTCLRITAKSRAPDSRRLRKVPKSSLKSRKARRARKRQRFASCNRLHRTDRKTMGRLAATPTRLERHARSRENLLFASVARVADNGSPMVYQSRLQRGHLGRSSAGNRLIADILNAAANIGHRQDLFHRRIPARDLIRRRSGWGI